ncbi:hypothetical protein N7G274_007681 [Stereocaulon virgatum]|uniref:F-box domain-containing protein n=1 Tax=Stereocaulon virgatum TaxID=373712 RepID=A0ABR4A3W8_9LECA
MIEFLSLPTEIRYEIYRYLRTDISLSLSPQCEQSLQLGYVSFGFHPQILTTNHQVCYEAKQVFYGENYFTFFVTPEIHLGDDYSKLPPLSSALPFMRRVHIRFRMFDCFYHSHSSERVCTTTDVSQLRAKISQVSRLLAEAHSLQSLSLVWTETTRKWDPFRNCNEWEWTSENKQIVRVIQGHIERILQPLGSLTPACTIQKSEQVVSLTTLNDVISHNDNGFECGCWKYFRVTAMETAFSNAINSLVAGRMPSI